MPSTQDSGLLQYSQNTSVLRHEVEECVHQFQDQTAQSLWSTDTKKSGLADEGNHLSEDTGVAPTGTQVVRSTPTTVSGLPASLGGLMGPSLAGKDGLSYEMDLSRRMKVV